MPKAFERKLKNEAQELGLTGERFNAYVYGTMRKTGWVPKNQRRDYRR